MKLWKGLRRGKLEMPIVPRVSGERRSIKNIALFTCLLVASGSPSTAADSMTVTLLGTGTPVPLPDRFGAAVLVEAAGRHLLIDCGRGATIRLQQAGAPAFRITALFLTHLHSDHVVGLPDLWLTGWIQGRDQPLRVWGPDGTPGLATHLMEAFAADLRIRQGVAENLPAEGARLLGRAIEQGVIYEEGDLRVTAFPVDHGHVTSALGYRIDTSDHSVVISGDAKWSKSLIEASEGADVLIHAAWLPDGRNPTPPASRSIASGEDAGRVFDSVRPKLAVVYHYLDETGLEDSVRAHYAGPLLIARDLTVIDVDDTPAWRNPPATRRP